MLKTIHALRIVIGFIAAWQILGLLPVLSWLGNLESTTGDMWAIVFIKFVVLLTSGALFLWLGRIKKRFDPTGASNGDLRAISIALATLVLVGIAAAIIIPMIDRNSTLQSNTAAAATTNDLSNAATSSTSASTDPEPPLQTDPRDALLQMHVEQLNDDQYNAAVERWLESHPEASSAESKRAMSQLLQEVYTQYPRSALGPALDMALQRGQRNASAPTQQVATLKFQCSGSYTKRASGAPEEFPLNGVSVEVGDTFVAVRGAGVFDGAFKIINKLENGVGFQNPRDETLSGFFNRISGQLSLIDRIGQINADGSFQVAANSSLNCQTANSMF